MGYRTANAALAYDVQPEYAAPGVSAPQRDPRRAGRTERSPRLDVITGSGREASQEVSPVFTHCLKVLAVIAMLFVAVGMFRVVVADMTANALNSAAQASSELEAAQKETSELEVMRSVYGSSTRIRDLAEGYGMVDSGDKVILDFTEHAPAGDSASADSGAATR